MAAYKTLRRALSHVLMVTIGVCIGLWICLKMCLQVVFKGRAILTPKPRTEEPACLRDPALGTHQFVTLECAEEEEDRPGRSRGDVVENGSNGKKKSDRRSPPRTVTLHYVSAGSRDSPLLLFVHGFPDTWYTWEKQIRHFQKDFWVVAVDMRGCGKSTKFERVEDYLLSHLVDDLRGLILALGRGEKKATVVGHDLGALACWVLATRHPDLVDRLIVVNGPSPGACREQLENSVAQMAKAWHLVAFQSPKLPEVYLRINDYQVLDDAFGPLETEDVKEVAKYYLSQPGALTSALHHYRALWRRDERLRQLRYRYLTTPTLIVWGTADPSLTPKLAQLSIQQAFGRVEYVDGAAHWPHRERPDRVNDHIRCFLRSTEGWQ